MRNRQDRGQAMEQPKQPQFTADEFIAWALEQPTGRFELDNGRVVAMAPERATHAIVKGNVYVSLRSAIGARSLARGLACRAFPDGMAVRIDDNTIYEPDALVRCGPDLLGSAVELNDPVVVVEVVSPFSRGVDRGAKLASYFSLPSVRHYLVVDTDRRVVIHHRRDDERRIGAAIVRDGLVTLDPPGLEIDTRDIFDDPCVEQDLTSSKEGLTLFRRAFARLSLRVASRTRTVSGERLLRSATCLADDRRPH